MRWLAARAASPTTTGPARKRLDDERAQSSEQVLAPLRRFDGEPARAALMPVRTIALRWPLDIHRTLGPVRRGSGDPSFRFTSDGCWRATRTSEGPATMHVRVSAGVARAEAWGPGADRVLDGVPRLIGAEDDPSSFAPEHRLVRRLVRDLPGLRIGRTDAVVEALVPTVLEQKVTGREARRAHARLLRTYGEPAPGPPGLFVPPEPEALSRVPYHAMHRLGVERRRADTIRRVCAQARRLEALTELSPDQAGRRLASIAGIGAWTVAEVGGVAFGDADAVSVGDYHIPSLVTWALSGNPHGDDERMLELLEPFSGHRGRVVRLLSAAGLFPPRHGPRLALRNIGWH